MFSSNLAERIDDKDRVVEPSGIPFRASNKHGSLQSSHKVAEAPHPCIWLRLDPVGSNDPCELEPADGKFWSDDPLGASSRSIFYALFKHVSVACDSARDDGDVKQSESTCLHLENACVDQREVGR